MKRTGSMSANQTKKFKRALFLACVIWSACGLAQTVTTNTFSVSKAIPDGSLSGLSDTESITLPSQISLTDVKVELNISGGFNGDYYAYLVHDDGFAVLLNRVGRTTGNPAGYADGGLFDVVLSDSAANNIHLYQNIVTPPGGGALTGTWAPDGRNINPTLTLDTDPSTATLGSFDGTNPNGKWTLFVADVSSGQTGTLVDWSLITTAVPEPSTVMLGVLGIAAIRFSQRRQNKL